MSAYGLRPKPTYEERQASAAEPDSMRVAP
jgi:hypothetical protein